MTNKSHERYVDTREVKQYKDFPYTVIGHTCLTPSFSLFLQGSGLKEIVKLLRDGEDLRITVGEVSKFEIIDTHHKYEGLKH